jgi:tetratricopeptide (TPR) repeat protein
MKRIAYGVLVLLVCGSSGRGQKRIDDVSPKPRQMAPSTTDAAPLQWLMMSGVVGSSTGESANVAPGGIVSVEHLKIPESAVKEMRKFFKDFDAGKLDDSVKHASKAIAIYPQWSVAHHNLGQTYARMGDYDKAIAEFQTAAELDTRQVRSWLGLSKVYFLQKRFSEGETAARRALEIDPVNSDAKYFLGRILVSGGKFTPEAEELLRKSKEQYVVARLVLANVYLKRHAVNDALSELRGYLAQPDAQGKEKVQCMVRHLTEPEGTVSCAMQ